MYTNIFVYVTGQNNVVFLSEHSFSCIEESSSTKEFLVRGVHEFSELWFNPENLL